MEGLRGFVGSFVKNPQDEMLRGLNQEVFWGLEDNIVPEISARAVPVRSLGQALATRHDP